MSALFFAAGGKNSGNSKCIVKLQPHGKLRHLCGICVRVCVAFKVASKKVLIRARGRNRRKGVQRKGG